MPRNYDSLHAMKHFFWISANLYGRIFGRRFLASFHHAVVVFCLHALGYDNGWKPSYTGEQWFVQEFLKKQDLKVCLDVGASIGNYTKTLLRETQADIYSFEPTPSAFSILSEIARNEKRLHPVNAAVSNIDGETVFYLEGERSERNSLSKEGLFDPTPHQTKVIRLDSFTKDLARIDFIKVDTEGFEHEVFEGMQSTLKKFRPAAIQFEFNILHLRRGHTVFGLSELLSGYEMFRLLPRGMIKITPDRFIDNIFMFSNIVAIRADLCADI